MTSHICTEWDAFMDYCELAKKTIRGLGDKPITTYGTGTVFIVCHIDSWDVTTCLHDMLHVPEVHENLLSLGCIDGIEGSSICTNGILKVHDQNGQPITQGKWCNNLYYLDAHTKHVVEHVNVAIKLKMSYSWEQWHKCLEHIAITELCMLHGKNLVNRFAIADSTHTFECDTCIKEKHTCRPLPKKAIWQECKLDEITHLDLWGSVPVTGLQGEKYYILFMDEATRWTKLMYLRHKNEAAVKMKQYLSWIKRQGDKLPKIIYVDNRCKYMDQDLITWCLDKGIEIHTTTLYTPKQNGIAEWYNRTIVKLRQAMLLAHEMPKELWPKAFNHTCYIHNWAYTRAIKNMTPHEKSTGKQPDISYIQEFGASIWILKELHQNKLDSKSKPYILWCEYQKGQNIV